MAGGLLVLAVILILFIVSSKERRRFSQEKGARKIFYPMAWWVLERIRKAGINPYSEANARTIRNESLVGTEETNMGYTINKTAQALGVVTAGSVLVFVYCAVQESSFVTMLTRPDYGMEAENIELQVNGVPEAVEVFPVLYNLKTLEENFEAAYPILLERMKGNNLELSQVREKLNLVSFLDEFAMSVTWYSDKYELVDGEGNVFNHYFDEEQTENVILTATLSCQDYSCIYEIDVTVCAPILQKEQRTARKAASVIAEYNREHRNEREIPLPPEIDGVSLSYEIKRDNYAALLLLAVFLAGAVVFFGRDNDLRKLDEKRCNQMLMDYPEIVSKLTVLIGAGMSVRRAWEKIAEDYRKNGVRRYAYEEMAITINEIRAGTMEGIAYSNFGRRCNIHEYLKLGAILEQNVKSGTKGLAAMLENEAYLAFETRKNTAVKMGEEAQTKLLMPMIMMLGVVLVIVMVPALMSLGM